MITAENILLLYRQMTDMDNYFLRWSQDLPSVYPRDPFCVFVDPSEGGFRLYWDDRTEQWSEPDMETVSDIDLVVVKPVEGGISPMLVQDFLLEMTSYDPPLSTLIRADTAQQNPDIIVCGGETDQAPADSSLMSVYWTLHGIDYPIDNRPFHARMGWSRPA